MWYYIFALVLIYLVDSFYQYNCGEVSRWFALHFFVNLIISSLAMSDVQMMLRNPASIADTDSQTVNITGAFAIGLHIYHAIFFKMTRMDVFHHVVFVFLCGPLAITRFPYRLLSGIYFIGTGLPGGMVYLSLCASKYKIITSLQQKWWNNVVDTYFRIPGGIACATGCYYLSCISPNPYTCLLIGFALYFNSCYFGNLAIRNYEYHKTCRHIPE